MKTWLTPTTTRSKKMLFTSLNKSQIEILGKCIWFIIRPSSWGSQNASLFLSKHLMMKKDHCFGSSTLRLIFRALYTLLKAIRESRLPLRRKYMFIKLITKLLCQSSRTLCTITCFAIKWCSVKWGDST